MLSDGNVDGDGDVASMVRMVHAREASDETRRTRRVLAAST